MGIHQFKTNFYLIYNVILSWQCDVLVDYYSPLLFAEIEKISPEKFCEKIHFCISEEVSEATNIHKKIEQFKEDTCSKCEEVIEQLTIKLKDPDTQVFLQDLLFNLLLFFFVDNTLKLAIVYRQFEIIEILLQGCNKAENFVNKVSFQTFLKSSKVSIR